MRTNYITNPSIETATTGWYRTDTCVGTAAITRVSGGQVGDYALQFAYTAEASDATGTATQYCSPTAVGTAAQGDKWTVSAYVKKGAGTTSGVTVRLRIAYYNEAGVYIGQVSGADIFSSLTTSFQRFSYTGTLPADGAISRVDARLVCSSIAYGDAFDLVSDAWLLEKVDGLDDYFDGSTTDTDDWDYEWAGTAHASLSTATPALYAPELVAYQSGLNIVVEWTQGPEYIDVSEAPYSIDKTGATSVTGALDGSDGVLATIRDAGGIAYFPAGTYLLSTALTVPDGCKLAGPLGSGMETAWLQGQVVPGSSSSFTDLKMGDSSKGCTLSSGKHDIAFERVRFNGYTGANESSWAVLAAPSGGVYNITFDTCTFSTLPAGIQGNSVHMWSWNTTSGVFHDIEFSYCTFEPQPRMQIELNGFGGWWHDLLIDHCTFKPCGGEILSLCVTNDDGETNPPYAPTVDGVVRGVENIVVTNNDLQGSGATVNGFAPVYRHGIELASVWKNTVTGLGASTFSHNRVGRCGATWLNLASGGIKDMTFEDNIFDWEDNYSDCSATNSQSLISCNIYCNDNTFKRNTWNCNQWTYPGSGVDWFTLFYFTPGCQMSGNTFEDEEWTHLTGTIDIENYTFEFTDSTYTNCHFHINQNVTFPASASGSGCVFDYGHTGGTFT